MREIRNDFIYVYVRKKGKATTHVAFSLFFLHM